MDADESNLPAGTVSTSVSFSPTKLVLQVRDGLNRPHDGVVGGGGELFT